MQRCIQTGGWMLRTCDQGGGELRVGGERRAGGHPLWVVPAVCGRPIPTAGEGWRAARAQARAAGGPGFEAPRPAAEPARMRPSPTAEPPIESLGLRVCFGSEEERWSRSRPVRAAPDLGGWDRSERGMRAEIPARKRINHGIHADADAEARTRACTHGARAHVRTHPRLPSWSDSTSACDNLLLQIVACGLSHAAISSTRRDTDGPSKCPKAGPGPAPGNSVWGTCRALHRTPYTLLKPGWRARPGSREFGGKPASHIAGIACTEFIAGPGPGQARAR
jgi:hypothetical protein